MAYYLFLSIIAGIFIIIFVMFFPSSDQVLLFNDRVLLAIVFIVCCCFGIASSFWPGWFHVFRIKKSTVQEHSERLQKRRYHGHHPDCDSFDDHRLRIMNKVFCAGCLGLALGSFLAVFLMLGYVLGFFDTVFPVYFWLVVIGLSGVYLLYIELVLPIRNPLVHVLVNIFFIVSFSFIVISVLEITQNKLYGLLTIVLLVLFLTTRIRFSQWMHHQICMRCPFECKAYT